MPAYNSSGVPILNLILVLGLAMITAVWAYYEALLASKIALGLSSGVYASLLGFIGITIAYISKLPLLRLMYRFEVRKNSLIIASILLLLALTPKYLAEDHYSLTISYLILSASYGLASASIFMFIINDLSYEDWRKALAILPMASAVIASLTLVSWAQLKADIAPPVIIIGSLLLAYGYITSVRPLIPSLTLKSLEILSDILAFRGAITAYRNWHIEVTKIALILGGLGALKILILSKAIIEYSIYSIVSYNIGVAIGAIIAYKESKPRITQILAITTIAILLLTNNTLIALALIGVTIAYGQISTIDYILENRPRAVYTAIAIITTTIGIGAVITGIASLANTEKATIITLAITIATITTSIIIDKKQKRKWE